MKTLSNFLLFSIYIFLVSVAVFSPLSLIKTRLPNSQLSVLGESAGPNNLEVTTEDSPSGRIISVSGFAYPGQNTYYNNAFKLTNQTDQSQFYKLVVLKTYPLGKGLMVELNAGGEGQNVSLSPGSSASVNVRITSQEEGDSPPHKFTAKILTLNLN